MIQLQSSAEQPNLSLRQLHEAVRDRGVEISYSALSELIGTGDVAEQLRAGGNGSRREFLPATVDVLAAFIPQYREAKARLPQAPAMLRSFLKQENPTGDSLPVPAGAGPLAAVPHYRETAELAALIVKALQQAAPPPVPPEDQLLSGEDAARLLACSVATLRKLVPAVRRGRWSRLDVLQYIQSLRTGPTGGPEHAP